MWTADGAGADIFAAQAGVDRETALTAVIPEAMSLSLAGMPTSEEVAALGLLLASPLTASTRQGLDGRLGLPQGRLTRCEDPRMRIGIIGRGDVGATAARLFTAHGHEVVIANSRGPESLAELVGELANGRARRPSRRRRAWASSSWWRSR